MQHVLVTGGAGFIGSNFIRHLFGPAGFKGRVVNLDKLTYAGNPENLSDVEKAQGEIIKIVRKMEEEGKIVLAGRGSEDALV